MATTPQEVWQLLGELVQAQKETDRIMQKSREEADRRFQELERAIQTSRQETDRIIQESKQETERIIQESKQETERIIQESKQETERIIQESKQETERLWQETDRRFQESREESDRRFQETERLMKENSEKLSKELGKLGNRLGDFVEWQVRPAALRLFRERGLNVNEVCGDLEVSGRDEGIEIDLLVVNTTEAVVIEVKSKLTIADVDEHLERLDKFKRLLPRYQDLRIFGAVAGLVIPQDVARYAYRRGFFVIGQSGENVMILNDEQFRPKAW